MSQNFNRRTALKSLIAGTVAMGIPSSLSAMAVSNASNSSDFIPKGKINHSVARWCFGDMELEALCIAAKKMGITGIDLVGPKDWPILQKHQLVSTMCNGAELNLVDGFNDPKFHDQLIKNYTAMIPLVAQAGYKNLICFSGNRRGKTDDSVGRKTPSNLSNGIAQQQNRPQRLPVRQNLLGRRIGQKNQFTTFQALVRHLPHAN